MVKINDRYKALLFDLDGTIIDSSEGISHCLRHALKKLGVDSEGIDILKYIGPPIHEIFMDILDDEEKTQKAIAYYREEYAKVGVHQNKLFDGIKETVHLLHEDGYKILLATSKPEINARIILKDFDMDKDFDVIGGSTLDGRISHKHEVILDVLSRAGIDDKSTALMIGDRKYDLIGAVNTGIDAMGVLFGFGTKEELEQYPNIYLAKTAYDIRSFLNGDR